MWAENPKAEWVLGAQDPPHWEMCKFSMARASCFYPMAVFLEIELLKVTLVQPVPSSWGIWTIPHTPIPEKYAVIMG